MGSHGKNRISDSDRKAGWTYVAVPAWALLFYWRDRLNAQMRPKIESNLRTQNHIMEREYKLPGDSQLERWLDENCQGQRTFHSDSGVMGFQLPQDAMLFSLTWI